jgi:membrane-associated protease RseP (regulator of RpoE activity)
MCIMRRVSGRYLALVLGVAALAGWNSRTFGRDLDTDQTKSATGDPTTWSNDLEPTENGTNNQSGATGSNNQNGAAQSNNNQNGTGNRQARSESDSDSQHHAFLGISMEESDGAVHVTAILPGSPAAKGGLRVGDEIRSVDGDRIRTAQGLTDELGDKRPGSKVELGVRRNGQRQTLQVRLGTQDEVYGRNGRNNNRQYASNDENTNRQNGNGQSGNNQAGGNQAGGNRNRSSSYDPNAQSLNEQLRALRQQVTQLQREVDDLRSGNTRVSSRNRSGGATRDSNDRNSDQDND